jgi:uncharacterized protein with HEPN domain
MPKDELVYVGHMLDKAQEALSLARGKTRQDYDNDTALRLALTHLIQVISEAARRSILISLLVMAGASVCLYFPFQIRL